MGRPAFFVRLFGCPVKCPWCDSAGTWHPDYVPDAKMLLTPEGILMEAFASRAPFVVVTGGEPAIHDLSDLTRLFKERNEKRAHDEQIFLHLETSGAFPIKGDFDWVTVSPKRWKLPIVPTLVKAKEYKFIIEQPEDISFYWELVKPHWHAEHVPPIWLHPEHSQRNNPAVLEAINYAVLDRQAPFRAGWQLHKLYNVDARDKRSRPLVPLGGDPSRGF